MPVYTFEKKEIAPFKAVMQVTHRGGVAHFPLGDKIVAGFATKCLEDWLGKDNAANILVRGERVALSRETPIAFDFNRFKP